jgi:branched-chain amino acid transport system substrate-binding protein
MRFRTSFLAVLAAALLPSGAGAEELRIGFINTFGNPVGQEQINAFKLGLEAAGWKADGDAIAGAPTKVVWCDDNVRPDQGLACARKFIEQDRVHVVAGMLWSNVLAAVQTPVLASKTILLATNAGTSQLAGEQCSRYFISSSWQGDTWAEVTGRLVSADNVKSIVLIAPNYQGGKDTLAGFKRFFTGGTIRDEILFKLGQTDYQPEFSKISAMQPEAVLAFAPGPMGIAFMKQWAAAGLHKRIRLYTVYMVDNITLRAIGDAAAETSHVAMWAPDIDVPANRAFVAAYTKRFGHAPSHFAAQAYDAARLIEAGLRVTGGRTGDTLALVKAMRRARYDSVRGPYSYNVNGFPIQDFLKREVVVEGGIPRIRTAAIAQRAYKDSHWEKCPEAERH